MLGVFNMSAAMPAGAEEIGASAKERVEAALTQLKNAFDLLESAKAPPELAARVHEAIDALEQYQIS
jgi:hypothetical protein